MRVRAAMSTLQHTSSIALVTALMLLISAAVLPCDAIVRVALSGAAEQVLTLSAGEVDSGGTASITSANLTGASAIGGARDQEDFSSSIDFGDLSRGDGQPMVATIGLRIRSNCYFNVVITRDTYSAKNLQYMGRDVSGSADGGSFIHVNVGQARATGSEADASSLRLSSALSGAGIPLSQLTSGTPGANSTVLASGAPVSRSGNRSSPGNAVDIPVRFAVPTGTSIGPISGGVGTFSATVQISALVSSR